MVTQVYKRDGTFENFDLEKITNAIFKAAKACGGNDKETANNLAKEVEINLNNQFNHKVPTVEEIQNIVEKVLIENRHNNIIKR